MPFVVLQELDRLKSRQGDSRIPNLASGAIRFIYNELKSKSQRLQGKFQKLIIDGHFSLFNLKNSPTPLAKLNFDSE